MKKVMSTGVDATPQSIQLTHEDLITELNALYVDVNGEGISETFEELLKEMCLDSILELINEKKEMLHYQLCKELEYEDDSRHIHMMNEVERCDSLTYNDMF